MLISLVANGDEKKARSRLRPPTTSNSHHISVFRTGVYLGVCLPALVDGLFECESSRTMLSSIIGSYTSYQQLFRTIQGGQFHGDALLFVYAAFAIPLVLHASCRDQCAGMVESKDQLHPYLWSVFFLNGFTTNGAAISDYASISNRSCSPTQA